MAEARRVARAVEVLTVIAVIVRVPNFMKVLFFTVKVLFGIFILLFVCIRLSQVVLLRG